MKTMFENEVAVVAGGWGARNECTPEKGFNPETHDCFDGGPRPKREPKPQVQKPAKVAGFSMTLG